MARSMAAILFIVAIAMQLVRGEGATLELGQIAAPFASSSFLPSQWSRATALLFEMVPQRA